MRSDLLKVRFYLTHTLELCFFINAINTKRTPMMTEINVQDKGFVEGTVRAVTMYPGKSWQEMHYQYMQPHLQLYKTDCESLVD